MPTTLVVLLPPKARQADGFIIVDLPCYYERKETSQDERGERRPDGEEECAKKKQ